MKKTTTSAAVTGVLLSAAIAVPAVAAEKVLDRHRTSTVPITLDNPCTPGFDNISGVYHHRSHTQMWLEPDGTARVHTTSDNRLRAQDANGVRYTGKNGKSKSMETFDLSEGVWFSEKDSSVLRLISQGKTPNFSVRFNVFRTWSPETGFRERVIQDSVTCRP